VEEILNSTLAFDGARKAFRRVRSQCFLEVDTLTIIHAVVITTSSGTVVRLRCVADTIKVGQGNVLARQPLLVSIGSSVALVL